LGDLYKISEMLQGLRFSRPADFSKCFTLRCLALKMDALSYLGNSVTIFLSAPCNVPEESSSSKIIVFGSFC
jgi:hypothetical protein